MWLVLVFFLFLIYAKVCAVYKKKAVPAQTEAGQGLTVNKMLRRLAAVVLTWPNAPQGACGWSG